MTFGAQPRAKGARNEYKIYFEGDSVRFISAFGAAVVVVQPGKLSGSGPATAKGKKHCVAGNEKNVSIPGCMYMTQYSIPGAGTLQIEALAGNQQVQKTKTGGKAVLLKGATFTAKFMVQSPAQYPLPARPGRADFRCHAPIFGQRHVWTTNLKSRGT